VIALKWRETRRSLTSTCHPSASLCCASQAHVRLIRCTRMPIYCAKANNSSGCEGGDPSAVYLLAYSTGMVDETCTNYEAIDGDCTPFNVCRNCRHSDDKCFPVDKYPVYKVAQYGQVTGATQMQAEISTRGPISCVICVTEAFANYSGGVFSDTTGCVKQDHAVEIAG
jgi:cathepsin X